MSGGQTSKRYAKKFAIQKQIEAETSVLVPTQDKAASLELIKGTSVAPAPSTDIMRQVTALRTILLGDTVDEDAARKEITSMLLELWVAGKPGVERHSSDHIEAELKVVRTIAEVNGLMKPQRQRLDIVQTEVKIDWGHAGNMAAETVINSDDIVEAEEIKPLTE